MDEVDDQAQAENPRHHRKIYRRKHFIGQQPALAAHPWLLDMLTALEKGDSAALLAAIDKGQAALGSAGR